VGHAEKLAPFPLSDDKNRIPPLALRATEGTVEVNVLT
jgi:hypothetical protein